MNIEQWKNNDYQGQTEKIKRNTSSSFISPMINLKLSHPGLNQKHRIKNPEPSHVIFGDVSVC
jgi:hypothetical protein